MESEYHGFIMLTSVRSYAALWGHQAVMSQALQKSCAKYGKLAV